MRLVVLDEIPEDAELRKCWNDLVQRMERPEIFYTCEWALAVQRAYASSISPLVFLGYEGDSLQAAVALASEKREPQTAVFLTGTTADYCDFLSEPGLRREFVATVFSELEKRRITKMVLANLPADSSSVAAISDAASGCHYHRFMRPAYECARVVLGSEEQRAALKQTTLGKKMLRRNLRSMAKQGTVEVRHDSAWNEIEPALPSFNKAHIARFLVTGRISNLVRPERRAFLYELARGLSRSGWIRLSRLSIGKIPVAWNYGFQFAGSWFWYQPTMDSGYEHFSPGFCLLSKIVETACDEPGLEVVDLGLGAEGYKERFATSNRQTLHLTLSRSLFADLKTVVRYRASALATASPRIEGGIRRLISYQDRLVVRLRQTGLAGLIAWFCRRIWSAIFAFHEVSFYAWPCTELDRHAADAPNLRPIDFDLMAVAAMHYLDDQATLNYLVRSAQRLRQGTGRGFAWLTAEGVPVHFCWVKDFQGFAMDELGRTLQAPCADAVLIFDCFTPTSARGSGFFAASIAALAQQLRSTGKVPWIFAAATNQASVRGIEKSGFTYRFRLGRKRILFVNSNRDSVTPPDPPNIAHAASAP